MEQLLALYPRPYDPAYPVVCYDERPCFLIGDKVEPLALKSGQVRKSIMPMKSWLVCITGRY